MAAFHPVRYHAGVLSIIFASKSKTVRQVGVLLIGIATFLHVAGLFVPNNDPNQTTADPPASTPTTGVTATTDANATSAGTDPYLAELKVLQDASSVYYNKTYEVSGQPYVHSILAECGSNCTTQKKISYNLGRNIASSPSVLA